MIAQLCGGGGVTFSTNKTDFVKFPPYTQNIQTGYGQEANERKY